MKLALISDIHSNLEALQAVLRVIDDRHVDAIYCLGDIVGYGAEAEQCIDLVRERCTAVVRGNHDEAVALNNRQAVSWLPRAAQKAVRHNRAQLSEEHLTYLADLPYVHVADDCTFVHAAPEIPEAWQRLDSYLTARAQFDHFETDVCFIGHSHIPAILSDKLGLTRLERGHRYIINVGSVGQPRDGDPRACVGFFDTSTFSFDLVRVNYAVERTAAKILASDLPRSLAKRLLSGV